MVHLAIYKMISDYNPNFQSVLEIGPGNGLLSFFMRRHEQLSNYSQVEVCESFYLLQSLINGHLFGSRFHERAMPQGVENASVCFSGSGDVEISLATRKAELNYSLPFQGEKVCHHYPWWRIGELVEANEKFDIVTSNANLSEFTPEALNDYAHLMHEVLADDGLLYVQCFGSSVHRDVMDAVKKMFSVGFRALLVAPNGGVLEDNENDLRRTLALSRGIFVRSGHERYNELNGSNALEGRTAAPDISYDCPELRRMCFAPTAGRKQIEAADVLKLVAREVLDRTQDAVATTHRKSGTDDGNWPELPALGLRHG